jgi:hypothetical protein
LFAGILFLWSLTGRAQESPSNVNLQPGDSIQMRSPAITDLTCSPTPHSTSSISLEWKADSASEGDYFIVERSHDGAVFETLSAQVVSETGTTYRQNDNSPVSGTGFYRVKWLGKSGGTVYSKTVRVSLTGDLDFKFYPNPADKLLIIRSGHDIDVAILDPGGSVRINREVTAGLQVINVSALEKGNYVLRIADHDSNRVVSEQLVKN